MDEREHIIREKMDMFKQIQERFKQNDRGTEQVRSFDRNADIRGG